MKVMLDKSITITWPRKINNEEKTEIHQLTSGQMSSNLPDDVAVYILENYKDNVIDTEEVEIVAQKTLGELTTEIKEKIPEKKKEFDIKKETEKNKSSGIRLEDIAAQV